MFEGIFNRAQHSVDVLVTKFVTRMAVTLPFMLAGAFAIAAAVVKLSEIYGNVSAYTILACSFAGLGLLGAAFVAIFPPQPAPVEEPAPQAQSASGSASSATAGVTPELLLTVLGSVGPAALPGILKIIVRNIPLLLGAIVLVYLLMSQKSSSVDAAAEQPMV